MFLMILKSFFGYKNYCRDCRYYQPPNWYCLNENFDFEDGTVFGFEGKPE